MPEPESDADIRAMLRALPPPEMPPEVAARLDAAVRAEVQMRTTETSHSLGPRPAPHRVTLRRRAKGGLAAALVAVTLIAVIGVMGIAGMFNSDDNSTQSANEPAKSSAAPRAQEDDSSLRKDTPQQEAESIPENALLAVSGTNYQRDALSTQVEQVVGSPGLTVEEVADRTPSELVPLANSAALRQCLNALGAPVPTILDYARYDSQPALLLIAELPSGDTQVRVVGPRCGEGDPHLLDTVMLNG